MALTASMSGANYSYGAVEDRDIGGSFEFTRRKRWPQLLLQELVGTTLFCLKPYPSAVTQSDGSRVGWKVIYATPSVTDMLGYKVDAVEGHDFMDIVFPPDQDQLRNWFSGLMSPGSTPPPSAQGGMSMALSMAPRLTLPGRSETTHVRMLSADPKATSRGTAQNGVETWEFRAHLSGNEVKNHQSQASNFAFGGPGAIVPHGQPESSGQKGLALWVMGKRVGEPGADETSGQSLDAFLELKLENERLHEELRELRIDLGEDPEDRSYLFPVPNAAGSSRPSNAGEAFSSRPQGGSGGSGGQLGLSGTTYHPDLTESESDSSSSSRSSSPDRKKPKEKKRLKKNSIATKEGEGMHVCVSCGRTDSPEWRKGPLGPKTLCNACGLRWAKRNSTAASRKEKREKKFSGA